MLEIASISYQKQFHKDNLRHLSRFPDFFLTFRILSNSHPKFPKRRQNLGGEFEERMKGKRRKKSEECYVMCLSFVIFSYLRDVIPINYPDIQKDIHRGIYLCGFSFNILFSLPILSWIMDSQSLVFIFYTCPGNLLSFGDTKGLLLQNKFILRWILGSSSLLIFYQLYFTWSLFFAYIFIMVRYS